MQKDDAISRQAAIDALRNMAVPLYKDLACEDIWERDRTLDNAIEKMVEIPSVDAVPVVRCKDCKHRPTGDDKDDLEFPDEICPCQCEDFWYSWKPADNWFCGNGERKEEE